MTRKALSVFLLLLAVAAVAAAQSAPATTQQPAPAKTPPPVAPHTNLKIGDPAPDFTLPSTTVGQDGKTVRFKLRDFKGKKNVVLAFYVLAFTGG